MKTGISVLLMLGTLLLATQSFAQLQNLDGQAARLDEFTGKGKWTVAVLWASDCHVCNVEAGQYVQYYEQNRDGNVDVIGISVDGHDGLQAARSFVQRHQVSFPNLIGEFSDVAGMYVHLSGQEWIGTPTIMVFNPEGELRAAQGGAVPVELIQQFINNQSKTDK